MNIRDELKSRIIDPFPKVIECDIGWDGLLYDLHDKLVAVDPNYTLFQVKEKFGGLRFYYSASDPTLDQIFRSIVMFYEKLSLSVCEMTGERGSLMVKSGFYKTLAESFLHDGWTKVDVTVNLPRPLEG